MEEPPPPPPPLPQVLANVDASLYAQSHQDRCLMHTAIASAIASIIPISLKPRAVVP